VSDIFLDEIDRSGWVIFDRVVLSVWCVFLVRGSRARLRYVLISSWSCWQIRGLVYGEVGPPRWALQDFVASGDFRGRFA